MSAPSSPSATPPAGGRPRFVVAAAPRSGTGYTATILSLLDRGCGHEAVFYPDALTGTDGPTWPPGLQGESSWLAVPFLATLPPGTVVLHQVRSPGSVVRSLLRTRFFQRPSPFREFAERHCPEAGSGTPAERGLRLWVRWNRMAERAGRAQHLHYVRYRLEDLDPHRLERLLALLGGEPGPGAVQEVWRSVPRDVNTRGGPSRDAGLDLGDAARGPLGDEVEELAARYGCASLPPATEEGA